MNRMERLTLQSNMAGSVLVEMMPIMPTLFLRLPYQGHIDPAPLISRKPWRRAVAGLYCGRWRRLVVSFEQHVTRPTE
jgi:hypothetical protein